MDSQEHRRLIARRLNLSGAHSNSTADSSQPDHPTWPETQGIPPAPPQHALAEQAVAMLAGSTRLAIHSHRDAASVQRAALASVDAQVRGSQPRSGAEKGNGNMREGAVGFSNAIGAGFGKYVDFSGRASRSEYWWWTVFNLLVTFVAIMLDAVLFPGSISAQSTYGVLTVIASIALFLPSLTVFVRRLHDTDRSAWWLLISLVPIVGAIVLLVFLVSAGTPGANRFGPPNRYVTRVSGTVKIVGVSAAIGLVVVLSVVSVLRVFLGTGTLAPLTIPALADVQPAPHLSVAASQTGIIAEAKAKNLTSCTDGIGMTFTTDALFVAGLGGTGDEFLSEHQACVGTDPAGTRLLTQCSPAAEGPSQATSAVYCRVEVTSASDAPLSISLDQFGLASDTARFPADKELSAAAPTHVDLSTEPIEVNPSDTMIGVAGFVIPADHMDEDLVLIWDAPGTPPARSNGITDPRVLLVDREPSILENLSGPTASSGDQSAISDESASPGTPSLSPTIQAAIEELLPQRFTPEEVAYSDDMGAIVTRVTESLTRYTNLLNSPQLGDLSWEALLEDEVDIWITSYNEALAMTPPESMAEIHSTYLLGLSYLVDSGNEAMAATRSLDVAGLERANALMKEATRQTNIALDLLNEFHRERGVSTP